MPAPAWIISSWQMESVPGALPGFKCWRAAATVTPYGRKSWRYSQDVMEQPSKGHTLPVKRAEMSVDSHLRISSF